MADHRLKVIGQTFQNILNKPTTHEQKQAIIKWYDASQCGLQMHLYGSEQDATTATPSGNTNLRKSEVVDFGFSSGMSFPQKEWCVVTDIHGKLKDIVVYFHPVTKLLTAEER